MKRIQLSGDDVPDVNSLLQMEVKFPCFRPQHLLKYHAFCDDFGSLNFSCVSRFIELLNDEKANHPECKIVYLVDAGSRELTNAAFLLGA